MPELRIEATVNGRRVHRPAQPHQRLIDFLRDDLNLTGSKEGCGAGECGTCSVFVDGVLMKSCLVPVAKAAGSSIETIEGLARGGEMTVLQKAFHRTGASQCGYCIPGMVMAATAALRSNPFIGDEEIKERLGGNICRCTGYQKIFDAVELARDVQNGRLPATALAENEVADGRYIGANVRRLDAPGKVSGALKYAGDMTMPHMLHMQVLRSPHPHAVIESIEPSGPADKAKLEVGDLIVAFDGQPIERSSLLQWKASTAGVGKLVSVRVLRKGKPFDLSITLGELKEAKRPTRPRAPPPQDEDDPFPR